MASHDSLATPPLFVSRRLVAIQALRGIAALMVVFHHVIHQFPDFLSQLPTEAGQAGVDLFFVISGFVMVYVTHKREQSARQFLMMRAIRIIPAYWFYTLAAGLLMFLLPKLFRANELTARHLILSLLFVPHEIGNNILSPVIKQGWTLNYEIFFYILFALTLAVWFSGRVALSAVVLVTLACAGHWARHEHYELGAISFYLDGILLEFVFGMLIARMLLDGRFPRLNPFAAAALIVAGFIALFAFDPWYSASTRTFIYGLPAAIIVFGALAFELNYQSLKLLAMEFIGNASYSIYLVHIFPIAAIRSFWAREHLSTRDPTSFILFMVLSVTAAIAFGAASYYAVERTSLRYLRNKVAHARLFIDRPASNDK